MLRCNMNQYCELVVPKLDALDSSYVLRKVSLLTTCFTLVPEPPCPHLHAFAQRKIRVMATSWQRWHESSRPAESAPRLEKRQLAGSCSPVRRKGRACCRSESTVGGDGRLPGRSYASQAHAAAPAYLPQSLLLLSITIPCTYYFRPVQLEHRVRDRRRGQRLLLSQASVQLVPLLVRKPVLHCWTREGMVTQSAFRTGHHESCLQYAVHEAGIAEIDEAAQARRHAVAATRRMCQTLNGRRILERRRVIYVTCAFDDIQDLASCY